MKKTLLAVGLAGAFGVVSGTASATVISGIDFGTLLGGNAHIELQSLAEQFINPSTTPAGTGAGMGYGIISQIDGNANYCVAGGGCALYYTVSFTGGTFNGAGTEITFTGTDVNIYYLNGPTINLLAQDSPANLALIEAGTLYASLTGHGNLGGGQPATVVSVSDGSLTGSTLSLTGTGLLDVGAGGNAAFANFLNGNGIPDAAGGFADLAYTESANNFVLNPKDVSNNLTLGCSNGSAATGAWCWQGTLNSRGIANVVPEPGTLALLALGLLGFGITQRRKS